MTTQFARVAGEPAWLSADDALVSGLRGRVLLDGRQLDALAVLDTFGPREAQLARLAERLALAPMRAGRVFDELIERGVVAAAIDHLGPRRELPPLDDPLVVIRENGREQSLSRLLQSLLADEQRFDVRRRYLLVDDCTDPAQSATVARQAREFAARSGSRVHLLGPDARAKLVARFRALIPAAQGDALAELFDPAHARERTGARGWNFGVLAAAGGGVSFVDNDTVFPLRRAPDAQSQWEPRNSLIAQTRYLDAGEFDSLPAIDAEPYAWLARHVGASALTLVARHGWQESALEGQPADALAHCRSDACVLAASGGVYGGLAFNSSAWLNTGSPQKLAGLWRTPYRHARLEADSLMHGVLAPRLVDQAWYAPLLCDARELLPFTGTLALADDTFFLGLLAALVPKPLFADVPALLGHFPVEQRSRLQRSLEPLLLDRNGLVVELFTEVAKTLRGSDRRARMRAIGAACADLAGADDRSLETRVLGWREPRLSGLVDSLSAALANAGDAPAEWRAHAQRVRTVNRDALLADRLDSAELQRWRWLLGQCAFAAQAWPLVWDDALERPLLEGLALE